MIGGLPSINFTLDGNGGIYQLCGFQITHISLDFWVVGAGLDHLSVGVKYLGEPAPVWLTNE